MRRLKIRQLILLIIRALIIGMFVLAFSRPTMKSQNFFLGKANVRTAAAIVLDNSMSMNWEGSQGKLYKLAVDGVKQILQQLKPGDQISLFLSCSTSEYIEPQTFESSETVLQILQKSQATKQYGNLKETVELALNQLEESIFPNKELYVVSDFQKTSWQDLQNNNSEVRDTDVRTFALNVSENDKENFSVHNVRLKNQIIELGKTITVAASVDNYSNKNINDLMVHAFLLGKRVSQNTVNIESKRNQEASFNLLVKQAGFISGVIEIENDPLSDDNQGFFSFYLPEKIRLLLYGDPEDLRFFELALAPNKDQQDLFEFVKTKNLQSITTPLSQFAAVVIADPDRLSDGEASTLSQYIKSGGHLLFFPGDKTDLRIINERLFDNLQISALRETQGTIGDFSTYSLWGAINFKHPIFSDIFQNKVENIDSPKFYFRIILDSKSNKGIDVIKFSENTPFLRIFTIEKGSVFLYSSALDPAWSDFVYKPIFPPLMFRTLIYISSQTQQNTLTTILGDELNCNVYQPDANYSIERPDGMTERTVPTRSETSLFIRYNNAKIPGIYKLLQNEQVLRQWAVNINPLESDMEQIAIDQVKDVLGNQLFKLSIQSNFSEQINQFRFGSEITIWIFVIALVLMIIEMFLSREDLLRNVKWFNRLFSERNKI